MLATEVVIKSDVSVPNCFLQNETFPEPRVEALEGKEHLVFMEGSRGNSLRKWSKFFKKNFLTGSGKSHAQFLPSQVV